MAKWTSTEGLLMVNMRIISICYDTFDDTKHCWFDTDYEFVLNIHKAKWNFDKDGKIYDNFDSACHHCPIYNLPTTRALLLRPENNSHRHMRRRTVRWWNMDKNKIGLNVTSAPIGTWKRTDRPNDQPTDRHTDMMGHREVTLPIRAAF